MKISADTPCPRPPVTSVEVVTQPVATNAKVNYRAPTAKGTGPVQPTVMAGIAPTDMKRERTDVILADLVQFRAYIKSHLISTLRHGNEGQLADKLQSTRKTIMDKSTKLATELRGKVGNNATEIRETWDKWLVANIHSSLGELNWINNKVNLVDTGEAWGVEKLSHHRSGVHLKWPILSPMLLVRHPRDRVRLDKFETKILPTAIAELNNARPARKTPKSHAAASDKMIIKLKVLKGTIETETRGTSRAYQGVMHAAFNALVDSVAAQKYDSNGAKLGADKSLLSPGLVSEIKFP